jgi:hypothetical protein
MKGFLLNLPDDLYNRLKQYSDNNNVSVSDVLREGAETVLGSSIPCSIHLSGGYFASGILITVRRW